MLTWSFKHKTGVFLLQFLLIFRKAAAGELEEDSGLSDLYRNVSEIDVDKEGVKGAKNFFTAKVCLELFNAVCLPVEENFRRDDLRET